MHSELRFELLDNTDHAMLAGWWGELEQHSDHHFFLSWHWIGTWLSTLKSDYWILKGEDANGIVLLAVLVVNFQWYKGFLPIRRLMVHRTGHEINDQIWIEYNGFLVAKHVGERGIQKAMTFLMDAGLQWDELVLGMTPLADLGAYRNSQLTEQDLVDSPTFEINLKRLREQGGNYRQMLSANTRSQLSRAEKAINKVSQLRIRRAEDATDALALFDRAGPLHIARFGHLGTSGFVNPAFVNFHRCLIQTQFEHRVIEVCELTLDDQTAAIQYNFIYRNRVYFYLAGVDYKHVNQKFKIGQVLHVRLIEQHMNNGMDCYDFMAGEARYKRSLGEQVGNMGLIRLRRPTWQRWVEDQLRTLRGRVK